MAEEKQEPAEREFKYVIVDALFTDSIPDPDVRYKVADLFGHAFNHPWCDHDMQTSIVQNICTEHGIQVPKNYTEED